MKNLTFISGFAIMLFFAFSCTAPPAEPAIDMASVKAEITALEAAFSEASNAKDAEALMAYYAGDAHSLAPNKPTMVGRAAIKAATLENMAGDTTETKATMAVTDVWAAGNIAVETGTWTETNEAGEVTDKGKYMSLFEKRDGKYVCIRDIWNTDMPKKEEKATETTEE